MKFYLDENISPRVADLLGRLGCDVTDARAAGNLGVDDEAHLAYAAQIGAAIVTRNRNDFIALTARFFDQGHLHSGVIIAPHSVPAHDPAILAKLLAEFDPGHPSGLPAYAVVFLRARPKSFRSS